MQRLGDVDLSYSNLVLRTRTENQQKQLILQIKQISKVHKLEVQESVAGQKILNFVLKLKNQQQQMTFSIVLPVEYPIEEPTFIFQPPKGYITADTYSQYSPISNLINEYSLGMSLIQIVTKSIQKIYNTLRREDELVKKVSYDFSVYEYFKNPKSFYYIIGLAILMRITVSVGPYHGQRYHIRYGDFECQRNWISIAYNRPITEWYVETDKDPWWRLDYPPVAGYVSYIFAFPMLLVEPQGLVVQKGYESNELRAFMRGSVILSDLIFYFIPLIIFCNSLKINKTYSRIVLFVALMVPTYALIDHGHFQYNCVTYGLILYAYVCMIYNQNILACILFMVSFWSKVMASFYSFGFLGILVGKSLISSGLLNQSNYMWNINVKGLLKFLFRTFSYGLTLLITTLIIWLPWILPRKPGVLENAFSVIFQVDRGLYNTIIKLPNFWCITDYFIDWESLFSKQILFYCAIFLCFIGSLPSIIVTCYHQKNKYAIWAMFNISLSFYFFAFSLHEKHIIYVLLFLSINLRQFSYMAVDFIIFSSFSIEMLIIMDKLADSFLMNLVFYMVASKCILAMEQGKYIQQINIDQQSIQNSFIKKLQKLTKVMKSYYYKSFRSNAYKIIGIVQILQIVTYFFHYLIIFVVFVYIYVYSNALMICQAYKEITQKRKIFIAKTFQQ